ncbi:SEC1 family transport protein-like protein SLY1 [Cucurbitaria berberidis CBS 394.84]|uniref:SEC1 family transport protein-like protein SLY1 n=1 Tax=Cucurbitaria berberidis CBS 394.84 TaxID=1168544 RepID=A0A9P4GFR3_9PLEO|nr:SEC1 family transport protein-like protein SLY1 [Cucurbitaria berberidis CBS 394.84]KAF1845238.1 SEC1 family transport protein-like protein SLY1 [Cucurbitaria berberidis CBS 394.84]
MASTLEPPSLRRQQIASLKRLLNLNQPTETDAQDGEGNEASSTSPVWKILILDGAARDTVASVLHVNDLRAAGVTIHLNLHTKRHPIPDTPVIYLVEPNTQNLEIITNDLAQGLYSPAYLNFLSSIPREHLESLGAQMVATGTAEHVAQLYDQHLNFVVADDNLFHLNQKGAYHTINSSQTPDQELDKVIDQVVSGLFSVVVTMGVVPIIRCPKGGAAEQVAAMLDRKLRDHLLNSGNKLFSSSASRPVLILVDRNLDLVPMLSHSWIYQSLVYDVLDFHLGKVSMSVPVDKDHPEKGAKKQTYDLTASDYFWARNASLPFPNVADDVTNEWNKYQADADNITKKTGTSSIEDIDGDTKFAAHLKGAMALLPELRERKTIIENHMSILEHVMEGLKNRKIDFYFTEEEELAKRTKAQVLDIIKDSDKGNEPLDKLRLFLQYYLTADQEFSRADLDSFTQALATAGCADTSAISYVKTVRQLTRMTMIAAPTQQSSGGQPPKAWGGFSGLSLVTDRFKEAGLSANFDGVLSGIKNFLPKNTDLTLTSITQSLMAPEAASSGALTKTESYLFFDPRSANARGTLPQASQSRNQQTVRGIDASFGQRRQGFSEAICFVVGGGAMDEFQNLQDWATRASVAGTKRRIVYGSTALYNSAEFIGELAQLGKESA